MTSLTKHHGLGNDFLVAFDLDIGGPARVRPAGVSTAPPASAPTGCSSASDADGYAARMELYNADGSRAEMSGNGIRCFAQALAIRRGELDAQTILTDAGPRRVELQATEDPLTVLATVDLGEVTELTEPDGWAAIGAHPDRPVAHLGLGNPHTVVGVDDVAAVDLLALGRHVPDINLEIVEPGPEPDAITMRVHERGAGITQACGTGAGAAAWAAGRWGLVNAGVTELVVHMDGGSARVTLDQPVPGHVTLTGPATFVATIEVPRL